MFAFPAAHWAAPYVFYTQQFAITIASGASTNTATLPLAVDTTKSFIIFGQQSSTGSGGDLIASTALTNSTTVTATRGTTSATTTTATGTVVYASPRLVKTVQQGTIALSSAQTSNTASLGTAVTAANCVVIFLGANSAGAITGATGLFKATVDAFSVVTIARGASGIAANAGYVVVEFQPGVIKSRQLLNSAFTSANLTDNATLGTAVDMANSILIWGGMSSVGTAIAGLYTARLTSTTNVAFVRANTVVTSRTPVATVIEFNPNILKSVNRGIITILSANTSATAVNTAVNQAKTWYHCTGWESTTGTGNVLLSNIVGTNPTTVTASRAGTGADTLVGYEEIEFN